MASTLVETTAKEKKPANTPKPPAAPQPKPAPPTVAPDYTTAPTYDDLKDTTKYKAVQGANGTTYYDVNNNKLFVRNGTNEIKADSSGLAKYGQPQTPAPAAPAPGTPAPTSPDTYYNNALNQGQTAYDAQMAKLKAAQEEAARQLQANRDYSEGVLNKNLDSAMQQAYVQQKQQQKGMNQQLAALGIKGGGSEQAYSNMVNAYQQTRGGAQDSFDNAVGALSNEHNTNLSRLQEAYLNRDADMVGKMYDQAREDAKWRESFEYDKYKDERDFNEDTRRYNLDSAESKRRYDQDYNLALQKHNLELDKWTSENQRLDLKTKVEDLVRERDWSSNQMDKYLNAVGMLLSSGMSYDEAVEKAKSFVPK